MIETYVLKEPITLGKVVLAELKIDTTPKGKFWRAAQQPLAVKADMAAGTNQEVTTYVITGAAEFALMKAMTGQPEEILDELGMDDFQYVYQKASDMLGNFKGIMPSTA